MAEMKVFLQRKSTYIGISAVIVLLILPHISSAYSLRLMITISSSIITAMGLNIVIGYMGYPSLAQSVFYGVGAYTMALMTLRLGVSPWIALMASPVTSFAAGYLVAIPFLKLRSLFFAIGTLALAGVVNTILVNFHEITGAESGLRNIPRLVQSEALFFYLEAGLFLVILLGTRIMVNSSWGKVLLAIREDEDLAPHLGIDTTKYKRLTFAFASSLTGLAGAVFISYQTYISSNYFTISSSFSILASTVIGGSGSLLGPIYGGLIVVGIPEIFREMYQWRPSFIGVVLVAVVLLSPDGVNGLIFRIRSLFSKGMKND
jgi:branched-chain amino acid transport system permease protein